MKWEVQNDKMVKLTTGGSQVGYLRASGSTFEFDGPFRPDPQSGDLPRVKEDAMKFVAYAMLAPTVLNMSMPPKAAKTLYWIKAIGGKVVGDNLGEALGIAS